MIKKMLASALIAGGAAGLLAALLHFAFVQDYLLLGEAYETGEISHFASGSAALGHTESGVGHDHGEAAKGMARNSLTVVFAVLIYCSYAMILVAGFGLAQSLGRSITAHEGLIWGIAGFSAFQLLPAMGLAPELPGTMAADLGARQVWWWATVVASIIAFGLMAYGSRPVALFLGVALLAAPHLIGAPHPEGFNSPAPAELGAIFAARVLGVGFFVWASLGWIAGAIWERETSAV